ncbi:hypothetical protein ILUMI_21188 [Ignelater luminosus]|uniref:FCP1 homology domain-containing protein n=1 Tax=Ignelater luminosus TaxID=2038154 RepID=A0A8K0G1M2_IGNLU|nr:hypothetical protein ILUMI_21188 [Ignelater luminosus]
MNEGGKSGQEKSAKRCIVQRQYSGEEVFENKGKPTQLKLLGQPRPGKKLLVLDVDSTIYDCVTPTNMCYRRRPYLSYLLEQAFKSYDIGLWSATDMAALEVKIDAMHLRDNPAYKLLFYTDLSLTERVVVDSHHLLTKPLSKIWNLLPEYGPTNTVICDDSSVNFVKNPRNGILVTPYYSQNFLTDEELLYLHKYLQFLAGVYDVRETNHENWKEIVMNLRHA